MDHLPGGGRRGCGDRPGPCGRRHGDRAADGRTDVRPDGGGRRPDRRRVRCVAGGRPPRRGCGQRARRGGVERAVHAGQRAGRGLLRGGVRLHLRGHVRRGLRLRGLPRRRRPRGRVAGVQDGPPPHWAVYFAVGDADETVDRVDNLGGKVLRGPEESPYGRVAAVQDPQGAVFNVIAVACNPNNPQ
ncbi:VOC family protein [Embleya sp. NPDC005575]|uniref:VOC family protein n=1 Tax=Embleya sp. NPDC005575 TaxID=3156892 RepID=UPI0033AD2A0B